MKRKQIYMIVLANFFATYFPKWFSHHMLDTIRHLKSPEQTKWISKFLKVQFDSMFAEDTLSSEYSNSLALAIIANNDKLVEHATLRKLLEYNLDKVVLIAKVFFKVYLVIHRRNLLLKKMKGLRQQIFMLRVHGRHVDHTQEISELRSELDKLILKLNAEPEIEFTQKTQAT